MYKYMTFFQASNLKKKRIRKTTSYGDSYHGIRNFRGLNSSPYTLNSLNGPQMFLKVMTLHSVLVAGSLVTLHRSVFLVGSHQVHTFEGPGQEC